MLVPVLPLPALQLTITMLFISSIKIILVMRIDVTFEELVHLLAYFEQNIHSW